MGFRCFILVFAGLCLSVNAFAKKKKNPVEVGSIEQSIEQTHIPSFDAVFVEASQLTKTTQDVSLQYETILVNLTGELQEPVDSQLSKIISSFYKRSSQFLLPPEGEPILLYKVKPEAPEKVKRQAKAIQVAFAEYQALISQTTLLTEQLSTIVEKAMPLRSQIPIEEKSLVEQGLGGLKKASKLKRKFENNIFVLQHLIKQVAFVQSRSLNASTAISKTFKKFKK